MCLVSLSGQYHRLQCQRLSRISNCGACAIWPVPGLLSTSAIWATCGLLIASNWLRHQPQALLPACTTYIRLIYRSIYAYHSTYCYCPATPMSSTASGLSQVSVSSARTSLSNRLTFSLFSFFASSCNFHVLRKASAMNGNRGAFLPAR
jgi:hypothetical protein